MSDAGIFVDKTLQAEGHPYRAAAEKERLGSDLQFYGASVGAVRGTIRDVARRYPGLTHDDLVRQAIALVLGELATHRSELHL